MNWRKFLEYGPAPKPSRVTPIAVRQLGIERVVVVRTKRNGGIRVKKITVKEALC